MRMKEDGFGKTVIRKGLREYKGLISDEVSQWNGQIVKSWQGMD